MGRWDRLSFECVLARISEVLCLFGTRCKRLGRGGASRHKRGGSSIRACLCPDGVLALAPFGVPSEVLAATSWKFESRGAAASHTSPGARAFSPSHIPGGDRRSSEASSWLEDT